MRSLPSLVIRGGSMVEGRLEGPGVPSAGQLIQKCWSTVPKVLVVTSFWRLGMVVRIFVQNSCELEFYLLKRSSGNAYP